MSPMLLELLFVLRGWWMSSEDIALCVVCVSDDASAVCVSVFLQYVLSLGFDWTWKKKQQQPQLSYLYYILYCALFIHILSCASFISCQLYLMCCEICVLLLWAYIIEVFSRSSDTVFSLLFLPFLSCQWPHCKMSVISFGRSQSAYLQDSVLLQH